MTCENRNFGRKHKLYYKERESSLIDNDIIVTFKEMMVKLVIYSSCYLYN